MIKGILDAQRPSTGEIETIIRTVRDAGAMDVRHTIIRLPRELVQLFEEWLVEHYPLRAEKVLGAIRSMRGGALYRSAFGERMRGTGPLAKLIADRVNLARKQARFPGLPELASHHFRPPAKNAGQLDLF